MLSTVVTTLAADNAPPAELGEALLDEGPAGAAPGGLARDRDREDLRCGEVVDSGGVAEGLENPGDGPREPGRGTEGGHEPVTDHERPVQGAQIGRPGGESDHGVRFDRDEEERMR